MLFKKKDEKQEPQVMQINLVDVVKQAAVQMKYEEIGSWLATHKTPLFWCHEKGFTIVDKAFIDKRPWISKALGKLVKEIEDAKLQATQQQQAPDKMPKEEKSDHAYIG